MRWESQHSMDKSIPIGSEEKKKKKRREHTSHTHWLCTRTGTQPPGGQDNLRMAGGAAPHRPTPYLVPAPHVGVSPEFQERPDAGQQQLPLVLRRLPEFAPDIAQLQVQRPIGLPANQRSGVHGRPRAWNRDRVRVPSIVMNADWRVADGPATNMPESDAGRQHCCTHKDWCRTNTCRGGN